MSSYKSAYELGLDPVDLQNCLDTDMNQASYDGNRQVDVEPESGDPADGVPGQNSPDN